VLDYIDYAGLTPNRSYGSFPDGQSFTRQEFTYVTPGATNNGASAPLSVCINEWMAGNTHTLVNPISGKYSDWFELYNYGTNSADLTGYYLTDNQTNRSNFEIPSGYSIPPRGFLLVWADGKTTNGTPDLHVSFKLDKSGESIGLYGADGNPVDYVIYGPQADDVSQGRYPDGDRAVIWAMPNPTPGAANQIPNTAPVLAQIGDQFIHVGQTLRLSVTATDAESAFQQLSFTLDSGAPIGATIDPVTGSFTWVATNAVVPSTNAVTVRVTDNGTPPLSGSASFSVIILPLPQLDSALAGSVLHLSFQGLPGRTYQVQFKDDLSDTGWTALTSSLPGTGALLEADDDLASRRQRYYRIVVGP
jgi:hypothetical protein